MNAWRIKHTLDLAQPIYAHRPMRIAGVAHAVGDPVDWRALGMGERKVRQLFVGRALSHHSRRSARTALERVVAPSDLAPAQPAPSAVVAPPPPAQAAALVAQPEPRAKFQQHGKRR